MMALINQHMFMLVLTCSTITVSLVCPSWGCGFGFGRGNCDRNSYNSLSLDFYDFTCPQVNDIVISIVANVIEEDPRMAASLLRLHFHDCFVQGCDASVLLDDSATIVSEKKAIPNAHSLRGFEVIDDIKAMLEQVCPGIVSCADILALAARASIVLSGGPNWWVPLGRRDSLTTRPSLVLKNIPAPNFTLPLLLASFNQHGLDETDLVALSGAHTIGVARCGTFKQRLYNQDKNSHPDTTIDKEYLESLRSSVCPRMGGDNNISPLDYATPTVFDNMYFKLVLGGRGLLFSDEALVAGNVPNIVELVKAYADDETLFFSHFAHSMVKMSSISPLLGDYGEVRSNCRRLN